MFSFLGMLPAACQFDEVFSPCCWEYMRPMTNVVGECYPCYPLVYYGRMLDECYPCY